MITANQLKTGAVIEINRAPHLVEILSKHTPSARGGAMLYKIRARNLLTRNKTDLTCRGEETFTQPNFQTPELQYLYRDSDACVFIDLESYEQYSIPVDILGEQLHYLVEGMEGIHGMILDARIVGIKLPDTVEMALVECDPAIKGASATSRTKPATTETGLVIQVPEHISGAERVKVDTRDGRYLSRA